jgi:hypothetical protein
MWHDLAMETRERREPALDRHASPPAASASPARAAIRALTSPGRVSSTVVAAAPALVFVAADAAGPLDAALAAAGGVALAGLGWRAYRRQGVKHALTGLLLVAACAAVAAVTGQERGFFLIPALIPFAVVVVCVGSVLAKRPLTGVLLNRVSGGPAGWREMPALRRVYTASTLACAAVNVVNAALQAVFYVANDPVMLAVVHIATGPVFAVIVAVTVVFARRAMPGADVDMPAT